MAKFEVTQLYAGSFFYPMPVNGGYSGGSSGGAGAGGFGGSGSTGGYISGSGEVISDFEGLIYIKYGNCDPYPVYVKPGKNNIYFFIPIILPVPTKIDSTLTIEAKGTILIPAGFKIIRKAGDTLVPVPSFKVADKFGVRDFILLDKETVAPPVDIDGIVDEYEIQDFTNIEIITATIKAFEGLETFNIEDLVGIIQEVPVKPTNADGILDKIVLSDSKKAELIPVNLSGTVQLEAFNITDLTKIEKQ
jgi:hypothetical protein